jgi:hypothetical protein
VTRHCNGSNPTSALGPSDDAIWLDSTARSDQNSALALKAREGELKILKSEDTAPSTWSINTHLEGWSACSHRLFLTRDTSINEVMAVAYEGLPIVF